MASSRKMRERGEVQTGQTLDLKNLKNLKNARANKAIVRAIEKESICIEESILVIAGISVHSPPWRLRANLTCFHFPVVAVLISVFRPGSPGRRTSQSIFSLGEKCDNAGDAFQVLPFQIELVPSTKRKESASFILLSGCPSAPVGDDIDDKRGRERSRSRFNPQQPGKQNFTRSAIFHLSTSRYAEN